MSDYLELYNQVRRDALDVEILLNGRTYTTEEVYPVKEPVPVQLGLSTLQSVADYVNLGIDKALRGEVFIRVDGPVQVSVESHLVGDFFTRRRYCVSSPCLPALNFGSWMGQDEFSIFLQSAFQGEGVWREGLPLNGKAAVLRYISKITAKASATVSDDGTAQAVVLSAGIGSSAVSRLPNPVRLAPWRTFPEVEQPESDFVFRLRDEKDGKIYYSLTEADGGAWRIEAVLRVAEWLGEHIADKSVPILY